MGQQRKTRRVRPKVFMRLLFNAGKNHRFPRRLLPAHSADSALLFRGIGNMGHSLDLEGEAAPTATSPPARVKWLVVFC